MKSRSRVAIARGVWWLGGTVTLMLGTAVRPVWAAEVDGAIAQTVSPPTALQVAPLPAVPQPDSAAPAAAPPAPQPATVPPPATVTPATAAAYAILSPIQGTVMDRPATAVTLQYPLNSTVELWLNGSPVDRDAIGRTETNSTTGRVTETWYGITLSEGENTLTLRRAGEAQILATTVIELSGSPASLTVKTQETRLPADGRSVANVEGEILDRRGNRSNWNAMVTLEASAGEFLGVDAQPDIPGFQVEAQNGTFSAQLQAAITSQFVRIRAATNNLEAFYQFQLSTMMRPAPLMTGVVDLRLGGRGTNFYDRYQDFLPLQGGEKTVFTAKGAAFGTASVGDWLITGAFNSDRPLNEGADGTSGLFRTVKPSEQQYSIFGDESTSTRTTPSQDSLFLKVERTSPVQYASNDSFMWGDYNTAEFATTAQKFTAIGRGLHGFKANYNLGNLQLSALYSNTAQGFQRDSIAPDGTSGFYFLSRRPILDGSEVIFLELEELNRPGTVVEVRPQQRGVDYTIDYDRGSILFREPILRTETDANGNVLVRKIVATYQYDSSSGNTSIYGGRARYHFSRVPGKESWLGGTYWQENQGARNFELYGADAQISLGTQGRIIAEYAHSSNRAENLASSVSGSAYRLEATGRLLKDKVNVRAFFSRADTGFANQATTSFVAGQTRYGVEGIGNLSPKTRLRFFYDREDNIGIAPLALNTLDRLLNPGSNPTPGEKQDNSLTTILAGVEHQIGKATLGLSYIHRDRVDRAPAVDVKTVSDRLEAKIAYALRDNLRIHALTQFDLSGSDPIYTNRSLLGLTWDINSHVSMSLNQHFLRGGQYGDRALTTLDTKVKYDLTKNTKLTGQFSLLGDPSGMTGQGTAGISHRWIVTPGLSMDLAYEYVMGQFSKRTAAGNQFSQPYAVGSGASALGLESGHNFSVGLNYTSNPDLKASLQYQYRTSSSGTNSVLRGDLFGKITPSLSGLVRYQQGGAANQLLGMLGDTIDLKVGLAYRNPKNDRFNGLFAYQFRQNPATTPETILLGRGTGSTDHTLSAEGIYAPNWQWELYGKVGYRQSTSYLASDLVSTNALLLGQLRATYRFDYRWDVVAEGRVIKGLTTGDTEFGATAEVGYYVTPDLRLAAGYAWGSVSNAGFDNARSNSGPYLGVTVKLDQLFSGFKFLKKPAPKVDKATATPTAEPQESPS
ncbi:TonB-dependent receptor [Altericista sp. CCNU0014]|uniref:TonB-dependent receptor n=1 Tax=Altericista sp. CCNU0014 TaxID=3082949 RepID=UPI00384D3C6A